MLKLILPGISKCGIFNTFIVQVPLHAWAGLMYLWIQKKTWLVEKNKNIDFSFIWYWINYITKKDIKMIYYCVYTVINIRKKKVFVSLFYIYHIPTCSIVEKKSNLFNHYNIKLSWPKKNCALEIPYNRIKS